MDETELKRKVTEAVKHFWNNRADGNGVRAGKTLDKFEDLIRDVVHGAGMTDAIICSGKNDAQLPGFYRPHKAWDVIVIYKDKLVAAIELKSQVGSIGNNYNNRTEEVLGSGIDLNAAIKEGAFGYEQKIFKGYMIVVEKSNETLKCPNIYMHHFPVMPGFLHDESKRDEYVKDPKKNKYPVVKGISYLNRYDELCKRFMSKDFYNAAAVVAAPIDQKDIGGYDYVSKRTSIELFMKELHHHCELTLDLYK